MNTGMHPASGAGINIWYVCAAILISAVITFALRALPFILFKDNRSLPGWLRRLGKLLPSAIMAVLIVYCVKDIRAAMLPAGLLELIAVVIVAASYKWKHNTFLSILLGTAAYMVMIRMV